MSVALVPFAFNVNLVKLASFKNKFKQGMSVTSRVGLGKIFFRASFHLEKHHPIG